MNRRENNIDLLRFLLAALVVLFHVRMLPGETPWREPLAKANGHYAVLGFFAISGYVVTLSWLRAGSAKEYFLRRARRLLPGYLAVVMIVWLAAPLVSTLPFLTYWTNGQTWRNLAANLSFLQLLEPSLPGVFAANPVMNAVNGSLWSIRTEIFCYLLVPLLARSRRRSGAIIAGGTLLLAWQNAWLFASGTAGPALRIGVLEPVICFAVGVFAATQGFDRRILGAVGGVLGLISMTAWLPQWQSVIEPVSLAALILAIGLAAPQLGGRWTALGNLSYGMYLWHFPTIQILCRDGGEFARNSPWLFLGASMGITTALAAMSWTLVERRFLKSPVGLAEQKELTS